MRLLILSATVLAFASAAPSIGYPTSPALVPGAFVFPAAVATISSGDIQAALIDAKVQAEDEVRLIQDQARAAADQARLIADQTHFLIEHAKEQPQLKVKDTSEVSGASVLPAGIATISPGDIQAAFIDAKVQAENHIRLIEDQARAAADQARLIADQTRFLAEQAKEQPQLKVKETSELSGASVLPAGIATISPGDIQAAFIDAKVQAEDQVRFIQDQARAAADQARLIADQTRFLTEQDTKQSQLKVKETNEISGAFVVPAAVATISPGDIQAAFIDAKVQAEDQVRLIQDQARSAADEARLIADQTRFLAEQAKEQARLAIEKANENVNGINQHTNEKALEAFLFLEAQKRQVVEAWKAVEAQVNEAITKDPSILVTKTGSNTFVPPMITVDRVLSPFPSPVAKSTTETETSPVNTETSSEKTELTVKTASITDESKVQEAIGANTESLTKCNLLKNALSEEVSEPQQIVPGSTHL